MAVAAKPRPADRPPTSPGGAAQRSAPRCACPAPLAMYPDRRVLWISRMTVADSFPNSFQHLVRRLDELQRQTRLAHGRAAALADEARRLREDGRARRDERATPP